jgi:hypothetical protein
MPSVNMVKSLTETTPGMTREWQLKEMVTEDAAVKAAFELRDDYETTDYADIGDNESDPFLLKMINLGHISHGASGFYDEHGHQMDGRHQH